MINNNVGLYVDIYTEAPVHFERNRISPLIIVHDGEIKKVPLHGITICSVGGQFDMFDFCRYRLHPGLQPSK